MSKMLKDGKIQVTVKEAYEALVKNGFEHLTGNWVSFNTDGTILGGCAMGQMAINLGVNPVEGAIPYTEQNRVGFIEQSEYSLDHQLNYLVDEDGNSLNISARIIRLNDSPKGNPGQYRKRTYQEICDAAYEMMKPYFSRRITLQVYEFKLPEGKV